jgi:hypothetical protein
MFGNKKIYQNSAGEIHIGNIAPKDFSIAGIEDVKNALKNLQNKKIFRCHVCNDIHIGLTAPEVCPTCFQKEAYVQINEKEIKTLLDIE